MALLYFWLPSLLGWIILIMFHLVTPFQALFTVSIRIACIAREGQNLSLYNKTELFISLLPKSHWLSWQLWTMGAQFLLSFCSALLHTALHCSSVCGERDLGAGKSFIHHPATALQLAYLITQNVVIWPTLSYKASLFCATMHPAEKTAGSLLGQTKKEMIYNSDAQYGSTNHVWPFTFKFSKIKCWQNSVFHALATFQVLSSISGHIHDIGQHRYVPFCHPFRELHWIELI